MLLVWRLTSRLRYALMISLRPKFTYHAAMDHHHFTDIESPHIAIQYNLVFSVRTRDVIPLPAPTLFDSVARGGYRIMPTDIIAYRNAQAAGEVAHQAPPQWDEWMPAPQDAYYPLGY